MKPFLILTLFCGGCCAGPAKQAETVRQATYAVHDAINAGRFDQADEYSQQAVRLIPPPKKRIVIKPIQ